MPSNYTETLTAIMIQGGGWSKVSSVSSLPFKILVSDYSQRSVTQNQHFEKDLKETMESYFLE